MRFYMDTAILKQYLSNIDIERGKLRQVSEQLAEAILLADTPELRQGLIQIQTSVDRVALAMSMEQTVLTDGLSGLSQVQDELNAGIEALDAKAKRLFV